MPINRPRYMAIRLFVKLAMAWHCAVVGLWAGGAHYVPELRIVALTISSILIASKLAGWFCPHRKVGVALGAVGASLYAFWLGVMIHMYPWTQMAILYAGFWCLAVGFAGALLSEVINNG